MHAPEFLRSPKWEDHPSFPFVFPNHPHPMHKSPSTTTQPCKSCNKHSPLNITHLYHELPKENRPQSMHYQKYSPMLMTINNESTYGHTNYHDSSLLFNRR